MILDTRLTCGGPHQRTVGVTGNCSFPSASNNVDLIAGGAAALAVAAVGGTAIARRRRTEG
jgi:hypothetical protein